ncbi:ATP-binding cassette domain-containing protein, partial [Agrobacterium sp. CNPSo 2736]
MDGLLAIEGIRKEFPGVLALDNVQLRVRPGTVHALMGENGAGKSTLMKIIAGVYQPDAGEIRLRGIPTVLKSPLDALEQGIAMIHQELQLMNWMTVAENIWIRREPKNRLGLIDHSRMVKMTEDLFTRLNIELDPRAQVSELTVAQKQMVEIARAVSYESSVLIMDEPRVSRTKPTIALDEIDRLIAAGVRFGTVLADAGYGLSAAFRQGLSARGLTWAVGIPKHQKVYPHNVALTFPVSGNGRPRKHSIPDTLSMAAETILEASSWK